MLLTHTHALIHTHSTCLPTRSHNHIFIHTHSHVCTLTQANTCLHTYAHVLMYACTYIHVCTHVYTLPCAHTLTLTCIHACTLPRYSHSNTCWLMSGHSPTHTHPHSLTPLNAHTQHVHSPTHSHPASQDQLCRRSRGTWRGAGEGPLCWLPNIPQGRRPGLGKFQSLRPADSALLSLAA